MVGFLSWAVSTAPFWKRTVTACVRRPCKDESSGHQLRQAASTGRFRRSSSSLTKRDTILYALGVGLGADPCDAEPAQVRLREKLQALPTMAIILGYPGPWHAHPTPASRAATWCTANRVSSSTSRCRSKATIIGKTTRHRGDRQGQGQGRAGADRTATVRDKASGELICTLTSTTFCRADGGFGGPSGPVQAAAPDSRHAGRSTCATCRRCRRPR